MRYLAFVVAIVLFAAPFAYADAAVTSAPKSTIAKDAVAAATVNLYCRLKAGKTIFTPTGSGVIINERGVILTNAHVAQYFLLAQEKGRVTGWCSVRTGSPAEEMYKAEIMYIPSAWLTENITLISEKAPRGTGENDFALLRITGPEKGVTMPTTFPSLPVGTAATIVMDQEVTAAGYPVENLDFRGARNKLTYAKSAGTVTNLQGFGIGMSSDLITLTPKKVLSTGSSGGPIVDTSNTVVGITNAKSDTKLRALSLPYINRMIQTQTGISLPTMIAGDLAFRSSLTKLTLPKDVVNDLAKGLRSRTR